MDMNIDVPRTILLILDSVGAGAQPDSAEYGDPGANTLLHVAQGAGGLAVPNLAALGLGRILMLPGVPPAKAPEASWGLLRSATKGKDTIAGHWEMMGVLLKEPFALYPDGFPPKIIEPFLARTGRSGCLGNRAASGTTIIEELGDEHVATGKPIVYTSADSVFQIAAHEEVIPLEDLYALCRGAREILDPFRVGRVIARPFVGESGAYRRTPNRKDFPMEPAGETVLDRLAASGIPVTGVGKIGNIFAGRGITRSIHTRNNAEGMAATLEAVRRDERGLIFVNLVDFDMLFGHRNDVAGYARSLEAFDRDLGPLLDALDEDDLLLITADHGCDPTLPGTDHTREAVPLLAKGPGLAPTDLGVRETFADVGATVIDHFRRHGDHADLTAEGLPGRSLMDPSSNN